MDIRVLRYFLTVAQEETITRAAERLHISQPSLSKQLIELEQELGKPLLVRGKRKISLTENGIFLRKRAEEILSLFEKTQQELTSDQLELTGEVSIGGNLAVSVLETAAALRKQHPAIQFHFYSWKKNKRFSRDRYVILIMEFLQQRCHRCDRAIGARQLGFCRPALPD